MPEYKLRSWIRPSRLSWYRVNLHPNAVQYLEQNPERIDRRYICANPAALHLLDDIDWHYLSENPAAIHLLEANESSIIWTFLSLNPAAIHLLEANLNLVHWTNLSRNPATGSLYPKIQQPFPC